MSAVNWIFSVRYCPPQPDPTTTITGSLPEVKRWAVVGPARASTVEAALHLAQVPEHYRAEIRGHQTVRAFVDGKLDPALHGYYVDSPVRSDHDWRSFGSWMVGIGSVHQVLPP